MQIADSFSNEPPSPTGEGAADLAGQILAQRAYHRGIFLRRTLSFWWYRVLLVVLGCLLAVVAGPILANLPFSILLAICGALLVLPFYIAVIKNIQIGLLVFAVGTTALAPKLVTVKSADIYLSLVLTVTLFCVLLVQAAFGIRNVVLPTLRSMWPHLFLFFMGIISNIMVQPFWTHGVPHKINSNPIIYDEVLGCVVFALPLLTYVIVTMIVATDERLIKYIQRLFILSALVIAAVVLYDFRRIGADIYTFRFSEPHIFWMSLRAIAQLLGLGCLLSYARFLWAPNWRTRFLYLGITLVCLICVILSLENSWWLETGVGLIVMTIIYSRRMIVTYALLLLPCAPLIKAEYEKLQSVKTDDFTRLIIWQDALRVWGKQPLLGVGPGNFWAYDQTFTNLPRALRNCNATGLCVSHNGYLQALGECGPIGLFLFTALPVVMIVLAALLYRRSRLPRKRDEKNIFTTLLGIMGFDFVVLAGKPKDPNAKRGLCHALSRVFCDDDRSERYQDHVLALAVIGLTVGSMVADFFAGGFLIPPRQISVLTEMPQVVTTWIMWGFVMYKDQKWLTACKKVKLTRTKVDIYQSEGGSY